MGHGREDVYVRLAIVGAGLLAFGAVAWLLGLLPSEDLQTIAERVWPILLFVVAVTIVAELGTLAGVFDVAAAALARLGRGRTIVLWLLVVALSVLVTAFLSLDTTAVLLTPVVIAMARAHRLDPLPFALTTVWLANTASLVLPVSNLTNLLAADRLDGASPWDFATLLGPSAATAIVVTVALLWLILRPRLGGAYVAAPPPTVVDRTLLVISAAVVVLLLPFLVSGLEPWIPASIAALVLSAVHLWRAPRAMFRASLIPWQLVVFASGLFLAVGTIEALGSAEIVAVAMGTGSDASSLLQVAGVGMIGANVTNNLPAYLALESAANTPARLAALLVGVNAGPLVAPWASLATLLWHTRLRSAGVEMPWRRFVIAGAVAAPIVVVLAVLPLALVGDGQP